MCKICPHSGAFDQRFFEKVKCPRGLPGEGGRSEISLRSLMEEYGKCVREPKPETRIFFISDEVRVVEASLGTRPQTSAEFE